MEVNNSIVSIYLVYIQDNKRARGSLSVEWICDKPRTERGTNGSRRSCTGRGCCERVDAGEAPLALERNARGE
jgi:hypothetical protein